jgi:hypothetical protein
MPDRLNVLRRIPGLEQQPEIVLEQLLRFANEMAGFYQSPVYLCGSALSKPKPRDIDVRIELDDDDFALRYLGAVSARIAVPRWIEQGRTGQWTKIRWDWSADCTKRTKRAWKVTNLNVDFQVYPASWCAEHYANEPKIRIDEMPTP